MANYTSQSNIEGYLKRPLSTEEESIINMLLDAADSVIDGETGRTFASGGGAVTQYYDAPDAYPYNINNVGQPKNHTIFLDTPLSAISKIEFIATDDSVTSEIDSESYVAYPLNHTDSGVYIDYVELRGGVWGYGLKSIKVTGTAGEYSSVPKSIVLAATLLCVGYLTQNQQNLKQESIEGYSRTWQDNSTGDGVPATVERLLTPFRRVLL